MLGNVVQLWNYQQILPSQKQKQQCVFKVMDGVLLHDFDSMC